MIRFACPGCQATYSVPDEKGGKAGRCPKCQAGFIIPPAVDGPAVGAAGGEPQVEVLTPVAETAPIRPAGDNTVEVAPCPGCQARLSVSPTDLGSDIECPYCQSVYKAVASGPVPEPAGGGPQRTRRRRDDDTDRPSRRRSRRDEDDDEDDRPRGRRRFGDDDEDEDDDRPSRRRPRRRRTAESKRVTAGVLALLLGVFGVHKFYLGYTLPGVLLILGNCVGLSWVVALVEGIIYLSMSDDDFVATYQDGRKDWF